MNAKTGVVTLSIAALFAGCAASGEGVLETRSPLDPARAYFIYRPEGGESHRVLDPEDVESALLGPPRGGLLDVTVLADGALIYGSTNRIERVVPIAEGAPGGAQYSIVRDPPCPDSVLAAVLVHPDTQSIVHGCRGITAVSTELFEGSERRPGCPRDQEPLAAGFDGLIFCSGSIVASDGMISAHELAGRVVTAVRSRGRGGFLAVARTLEPRSEALFAIEPDGTTTKLGDYPALPEDLDGMLIIGTGTLRPRGTALLADGTYYQLALHGSGSGPHELFRLRIDETAVAHLAGATPPDTVGRLVTGP